MSKLDEGRNANNNGDAVTEHNNIMIFLILSRLFILQTGVSPLFVYVNVPRRNNQNPTAREIS